MRQCCPGSLVECYDELGTRYSIPVYCLSLPVNLVQEADRDSPADFSEPMEGEADTGVEIKVNRHFYSSCCSLWFSSSVLNEHV